MARIALTVTVAQITPVLCLAFPGDDPGTTVPAVNASGLSLAVADMVRVEVRSPLLPRVIGRLS